MKRTINLMVKLSVKSTIQNTFNSRMLLLSRCFSTEDSHKDFEPQIKKQPENEKEIQMKKIDDWIKGNDVVLFMKGKKEMPKCGYSNYLCQILKFYKIEKFQDINVLESDSLRQAVKDYSNWPTFPQLYVKGEFVGGCDIVKEMHENGSFQELCEKNNLI